MEVAQTGVKRPKSGGRVAGTPNKATLDFKMALTALLDHAAPQMVGWLQEVADNNPEKALDTVSKYIEFVYPKLARAESKVEMDATVTHRITEPDTALIERYKKQLTEK